MSGIRRVRLRCSALASLLISFGLFWSGVHASAGDPERSELVVGVKSSPPFAYKQDDGTWAGISIELWERVAEDLGLEYQYREAPLADLLNGLTDRELDAVVAAISVTAERSQRVEFCHPHYTTGLGIATNAGGQGDVWQLARRIVSKRLLIIVAVMLAIVAVCGLLFWRFEREVNQNLFGGKRRKGIEMGLWWSTILLLGHKGIVPVSTSGRIVAGAAMLASLAILSVVTGVITSILTVHQLDFGIDDPGDLRHTRVLTVKPSTAADFLQRRRIGYRAVSSVDEALREVSLGRADAVVYDRPLLQYVTANEFSATVQVLSVSFHTQEYAIALTADSPLRKPLNTAILRYRASDEWEESLYRYLGEYRE